MSAKTFGLAQSVQVRLLAQAKRLGVDPNLILVRFATERYLYRLSRSRHADRFVMKGALLMLVWLGETIRPTRNADLLGLGELSDDTLVEIFREVCTVTVAPDGVEFLPDSVTVMAIREADPYGGRRVTIRGKLGMRDFFDLYALAEHDEFDGRQLAASVRSTFERRRTAILPNSLPFALTADFAAISEKQAQWTGFLRKNRLTNVPQELEPVIERLARFLGPILEAVRDRRDPPARWPAGGPWQVTEGAPKQRRKKRP